MGEDMWTGMCGALATKPLETASSNTIQLQYGPAPEHLTTLLRDGPECGARWQRVCRGAEQHAEKFQSLPDVDNNIEVCVVVNVVLLT